MKTLVTIPNPMRSQRAGKIIALILIIVGIIKIEPNLHFTQVRGFNIQALVDFIGNSYSGILLITIGLLQLLKTQALSLQGNFGKKHCIHCQKETQDILVVDGDKRVPYCRIHLLQEFSKSFLQFPHRMIVFHPEQDRTYCGTMYPYYPLSEFKTFNFLSDDTDAMQKILQIIDEKCAHCKKPATVVYFRKGILQWDSGGPVMREVNTLGESLCKSCSLKRIEPDLNTNKNPFADNGLFIPYSSEGVFINTYL